MPTVRIPAPLRPHTGDRAEVVVVGATAGEVLEALGAAHPGVRERLVDDRGRLHRFVNVFVGDDDVRELRGLDTPVRDDEVVTIVPAVAGGGGDARSVANGARTLTGGRHDEGVGWGVCTQRARWGVRK